MVIDIKDSESIKLTKKSIKQRTRELIKKDLALKILLEKHKITGNFIKEVTEKSIKDFKAFKNARIFRNEKFRRPIDQLLFWDETKQGYDYWCKLNNEYAQIKNKF